MTATRRRDVVAALGLVVVVLALTMPAILAGALGPKARDHRFHHLPLVREWSATWPVVDLHDYNSATGPLYHWLLAGTAQITGTAGGPETSPALQITSSLFAAIAGLIVFGFARRVTTTGCAFLAGLAVICSPYVLGNAIWMMTDNLSLALVAATVGLAAFGTVAPSSRLMQGVTAAAAVATRQVNIWLLAPMAVSWWMSGRRTTWAAVVASLLPIAVLLTLVVLWKGLLPPRFRTLHASGINLAAIGFTLTLCAAYGAALLVAVPDGVRAVIRRPRLLLGSALGGAVLSALGPSFALEAAGRNGGWVWQSVARLPVIADRSLLIVLGGAAGAVVLVMLFAAVERAGQKFAAIVILASLAGFVAAHVANFQVFQRYYDPMVLLTLVWLVVLTTDRRRQSPAVGLGLGLAVAQQVLFAIAVLYLPMLAARD